MSFEGKNDYLTTTHILDLLFEMHDSEFLIVQILVRLKDVVSHTQACMWLSSKNKLELVHIFVKMFHDAKEIANRDCWISALVEESIRTCDY